MYVQLQIFINLSLVAVDHKWFIQTLIFKLSKVFSSAITRRAMCQQHYVFKIPMQQDCIIPTNNDTNSNCSPYLICCLVTVFSAEERVLSIAHPYKKK